MYSAVYAMIAQCHPSLLWKWLNWSGWFSAQWLPWFILHFVLRECRYLQE